MLGTLIDSGIDCLAFEGALPLCPFPATVEPKARGKTQSGGVYITSGIRLIVVLYAIGGIQCDIYFLFISYRHQSIQPTHVPAMITA
jgi:hypothetical protein